MILFLLKLLLMIAAPAAHIILCVLRVTGRIKLSIWVITLVCLVAGIGLPVLATYIDVINLPPDVRCATGSVGFACLGILTTVTVIPTSTVIFYTITYYKRKKLNAMV